MINAPPLPARFSQNQLTQPALTQTQNCSCPGAARVFNANVERGATFSAQITLSQTDQNGVKTPIDVTGNIFQYTAKPHQDDGTEIDDDDPRTVKIDWQESFTATQGITWLIVPADTTVNMQSVPYDHQLRMVSPSNIVTPIFTGSLAVTEPVSARS